MAGAKTNELLRAITEGAVVVNEAGDEVEHKPARVGDKKPWLRTESADLPEFRFRSGECHAVTPNGGGPWAVARLLQF